MSDKHLAEKRGLKVIFYSSAALFLLLSVGILVYGKFICKPENLSANCDEKAEEKYILELEKAIDRLENSFYDENAFNILKKYAAKGNVKAQNFLALCYSKKTEYNKKLTTEACDFAQKLIDSNNPYGYYLRGFCHYNNCDKKFHSSEWDMKVNFSLAADKGVPEAALLNAIVEDDPAEAEKYFKLAIQKNYATAIHQYAWFLVGHKRYAEAIKILQTANDRRSFDLLALCYHNGWGVPIDSMKAFEYAKKSLEAPDVYRFFPAKYVAVNHNSIIIYEIGLEEAVFNGRTAFYEQCLRIAANDYLDRASSFSAAHDSEREYGLHLLKKKDWNNGMKYLESAAEKKDSLAIYIAGYEYLAKEEYKKAENYFLQLLTFPDHDLQKKAIKHLTYIYLINQDFVKLKHFAALGHEWEITYCRDQDAMLAMRNSGDAGLAKGAALFSLSAKENSKDAEYMLEEIFKSNFKRLQNIANNGNADAMFALSEYYCKKGKNSPEYEKGKEYFEKAVNLEHPISCYILANIYARGLEGHKMDLQKAMKYYKIAAAKGFKPATKNIAFLLATRPEFRNTPVDEIKYWYEVALFQDEEEMYFHWGKVFENIVKDEKFAEELYREGAKRNDYNCLIVMYSILKKRNSDEAHTFLERAIDCKFWKGYFFKGLEYEKTQPRDAYMNYIKSYWQDANPFNAEKIVQCLFEGIGCKADYAKAIKFAEGEIEKGAINMYRILGDAFRDGKFVPKDLKRAKEYYTKGAAAGNSDCKAALEKLNNIKP